MAVLTNLLFVLTFGLTVTTEVDLQKRIINGRNCLDHERPYHVKFEYPHGDLRCGGSLIGDRWILTAAHCWVNGMIALVSPHPGPGQEVLFGQHHTLGNVDIMLVELDQPTANIPHIQLPDCDNRPLQIGDVVQIAGYGWYRVDQQNRKVPGEPPVLQCAESTVEDSDTIIYLERNIRSRVFHVNTDHVDTSQGDSGGGWVFNDRIYGVHVEGGEFAHTTPATFVDVCAHIDWIRNTTGIFN